MGIERGILALLALLALPAPLGLFVAAASAQSPEPRQPPHPPPAAVRTATGRVLDVLGEPVPAATVRVLVGERTMARTATDGEGVYRLSVPADGGDLEITAPGKARCRLPWRGPATATVRHATLLDADRLTGRLIDAQGRAAAQATVVVVHGADSQRTTTDADGEFTFPAVPLSNVLLRAFDQHSTIETTFRFTQAARYNLQLPADRANQARRRTVRIAGLPVAATTRGGAVRVISPDMALLPNGGREPLDADGSARLLLGEWALIEVEVPGFTIAPRGLLVLGGGPDLTFRATPCDPDARPVELTGRVRTTHNGIVGNQQLVVRNRSHGDLATGTTDAAGNFRIQVELPAGRTCRIGMPLDECTLVDDECRLRDGFSWVPVVDPSEPIQLWVQPNGRVRCQVRTADGTRMALGKLVVQDPEADHRSLLETACDQAGRLALSLPEDRYELLAWSHDGQVCTATVDLQPGRPLTDVAWRTIATGSVTGRLVDESGAPLPNTQLFFACEAIQNSQEVRAGERQSARVRTDRDGRFRCRGLPCGEWTLVAIDEPGIAPQSLTVEASRETRLELTRSSRQAGAR